MAGSIAVGSPRLLDTPEHVPYSLCSFCLLQVYAQPGDGVTYVLQAPRRTNFSVATPLQRTPGVYQLYSVEWIALGSFWNLVSRLQVMDGTVLTNVTAMTLTTNNATMVLPPSAVVPLTFNQPTKEAYSIP